MTPADPALAQLSGAALRQPTPLLRRVTAFVAIAMVLIGLLLLYLLAKATNSGEMYEQNYTQLFTINLVVAGALGVLIAWAAWRMYQRLRQGRFGSRLLLNCHDFCAGGCGPRFAYLRRVLPVCVPLHRNLV